MKITFKMSMLSLTYIFHSCFLLKAEGCCSVIFDFWKCSADEERSRYDRQELPAFLETVPQDLPLYVVVSHHHKDHFNPSVFRWTEMHRNIRFVLSNDTARFARHYLQKMPEGSYTVLRNGEEFSEGAFRIKAFPSTDIGNSYVVSLQLQGMERSFDVLHAGDLNSWLWLDESTESEIKKMQGDYRAALRDIAADFPKLDIAMFPVDSRLGRGYYTGAYELVRKMAVDRFFPMHFGLGENVAERQTREADAHRFDLYANKEYGEYIALQSPGELWAGLPVSR